MGLVLGGKERLQSVTMTDHPLAEPGSARPAETADDVRRVFAAKVLAEVAAADALAPGSDAVPNRGNPLARVLVLKGLPGPAEASGGEAVCGADGDAIAKGLVALGYSEDDAFFALTRPEPAASLEQRIERVAALVEAVDPLVAVALDTDAADDLSAAIGEKVTAAAAREVAGRRFVVVDGMEASLGNDDRKKKVWQQLKAAAPAGPIY
jgi:hypothetical protein